MIHLSLRRDHITFRQHRLLLCRDDITFRLHYGTFRQHILTRLPSKLPDRIAAKHHLNFLDCHHAGSKVKGSKITRCSDTMSYDIRSIDVHNQLGWNNLEQKREYTKSMLMYKIINDDTAPNLKQSFRLYSKGDTMQLSIVVENF